MGNESAYRGLGHWCHLAAVCVPVIALGACATTPETPTRGGAAAGSGGGAGATAGAGGTTSQGGSTGSGGAAAGAGGTTSAAGTTGAGGATAGAGGATAGAGGATAGAGGTTGAGGSGVDAAPPVGTGLAAPVFAAGDLDPASNGGTITFQSIGAPGWYPSRRDLATGPCDANKTSDCCQTKLTFTSDKLTPWDQDLSMTLRGPFIVKQFATYQPAAGDATKWNLVSTWDDRTPSAPKGVAFTGNKTETTGFNGIVGTECLTNVQTDRIFTPGPGSVPYCPPNTAKEYWGWEGSKFFIILAANPHQGTGTMTAACSTGTAGGWYDAPWIGLSHGEMVRCGNFGNCQCYAKNGAEWWLADGCGQFNVFEVVNDNNSYKNLELYSTNFFGYAGYVGEGPCGTACGTTFPAAADLINKSTKLEATAGAISNPTKGPGAAFRRPAAGYRYFLIMMDVDTRTVQLGIVHPQKIPASIASLLPNMPTTIPRATVDAVIALRLPK